ncbi:tetratricopeptide repeat protein [Haloglycomyces albus]|uniref:tetratricopeptide repeat protein n=1 Tax=Haloglycomyces albus TaxID=526067 RepID=UPI00046D0059|nr:tetratricopeptide repeat protein [Haloglycomyces albus]
MDDDSTRRTADEFTQRAEVFYDLDRLPEAKTEIESALAVEPFHVDANALAASLALAEEDAEGALTYASTALSFEPLHERAWITRGYALARLKRRDEAKQAAETLLTTNPDSWMLNVHYALIVRESGAAQPALDAAWNAVRLAPDEQRTHLTLAAVAESLDMDDLAKRARQAAQDVDQETVTPQELRDKRGPEEESGKSRPVEVSADDPQWREKLFSGGPLRGPLLRSVLAGITGVFGVLALLSTATPTGGRVMFGIIALAAGIAWAIVLQKHRQDPN